MESSLVKFNSAIKYLAGFSLLLLALLFISPANAAAREVNAPINAAPIQLAYYGGYYHYHHWNRWHRWHRYHHWHYWHRW